MLHRSMKQHIQDSERQVLIDRSRKRQSATQDVLSDTKLEKIQGLISKIQENPSPTLEEETGFTETVQEQQHYDNKSIAERIHQLKKNRSALVSQLITIESKKQKNKQEEHTKLTMQLESVNDKLSEIRTYLLSLREN